MLEGDLSIHNPNLSSEKKKLLIEIQAEILRKYRYRKIQISIDSEITCFTYIDEN